MPVVVASAAPPADASPPAVAPAHLRATVTPVPPEVAAAGGMLLADQPGMAAGFGELTAHDFLRVNVDVPNLKVLCVDPPVCVVEDFLTAEQCDALVDAARASGKMRVSAVGGVDGDGATTTNIRTSKTVTLNTPVRFLMTGPRTTPFASWTPFLKDFFWVPLSTTTRTMYSTRVHSSSQSRARTTDTCLPSTNQNAP
jgi:hypothetical protein